MRQDVGSADGTVVFISQGVALARVKVDHDNQSHAMTIPAFLNAGFCT
jgi:hypothetical protein